MSNKGKHKRKAKQALKKKQRNGLKRLLANGKIYLNMNSEEWRTGKIDGIDIRRYCVGYRVPMGTTPEEEAKIVQRWRDIDAILNQEKKESNPPPKVIKPKLEPKKPKKKRFKSHVEIELIGTKL